MLNGDHRRTAMSLQQREICKVGESPTPRRRSLSPRRGSGPSANEDNPDSSSRSGSPCGMRSKGHGSSSSSGPDHGPEPALRPERRISTRLLMQKGEAKADLKSSSKSSPKHAAWKTSKFFSKSMASGELLKGFKKMSTPSSTVAVSVTAPAESAVDANENKESESIKSFKSRFSSLRRKSGSDTDNVPKVDTETLKLGSPDVRGIVCKKEDLIKLIAKVPGTRERRISSPAELIVPVASSLPTSPIPVLKSPSLKVAPSSPLTRGSFKTSRSASLDPTQLPNIERPPFKTPGIVHHPDFPQFRSCCSKKTTDDICIKKTGTFLEVVPEIKRRLSGPLIEIKDRIIEENEEDGGSETPVQWDDSNFVDPNLLGGAIEAFLKGMGTSPSSTPTTEKRVSFKKSLIK